MEKYQIMIELDESIDAFSFGAKTREDVEKQIEYYEKQYNFDGRDAYIERLDRIEEIKGIKKKKDKKISQDNINNNSFKWIYVIAIVALIILGALLLPMTNKDNNTQMNEQRPEPTEKKHEKYDSDGDGFGDKFEEEHSTVLDKDTPNYNVDTKDLLFDD